ncbi:MAG: 2Fe-2S iron-sulfur cluster-binding protein [Candidatus Nanohaloarchaea archaeon]
MAHEIEMVDREVTVEAEDGQTVLNAILEGGEEYMHACGGFCNCTTCRVEIVEGEENVTEMQEDEESTLRRFQGEEVLEGSFRLSCQVEVHGDIKIREPDWY